MKLAFCLSYYFPHGGLQRDFIRIAQSCHELNHEIHVYTLSWQEKLPTWIHLHLLPIKASSNHTRIKRFAQQIIKETTKQSFDSIIGFNKMPGLDIYFAADSCFVAKPHYRNPLLRWLPRYRTYAAFEKSVFSRRSKTQILAISPKETQKYQQFYQTPSKRFHSLPPNVEKNRISPDNVKIIRQQTRQQYNIRDQDFLLLSIGSNFHTKGIDRTIKAIKTLPPPLKARCHLLIIGHEKKLQRYEKLVNRCRLNTQITFLGTRNDIPRFLFAADLLVHAARTENTGTAIVEAIVANLPIIVTKNCGYAHYVDQAHAGSQIPTPFSQKKMNGALEKILDKALLYKYTLAEKIFIKSNNLHGMVDVAIHYITQLSKK